jgi:hypothetical protein
VAHTHTYIHLLLSARRAPNLLLSETRVSLCQQLLLFRERMQQHIMTYVCVRKAPEVYTLARLISRKYAAARVRFKSMRLITLTKKRNSSSCKSHNCFLLGRALVACKAPLSLLICILRFCVVSNYAQSTHR